MIKYINNKISLVLLLILILCGAKFTLAQTTSFITLGSDQGLIQSQVQSITQDNEGNLWVGTIAGLTKYNGTKCYNYTMKDGLAEDWITTSYKDDLGNIWFGHWAGGLTRYNHGTKQLESLNFEEYSHFKSVTKIEEDSLGRYWIATEGSGIFVFEPEANKTYSITSKDGLSSNNIFDIHIDKFNNVWMATDSGLTVFNTKNKVTDKKSFIKLNKEKGLFSNNITSILFAENTQQIWLGSADNGIAEYNFSGGVISSNFLNTTYTVFNSANGLKSTFIKTIQQDHLGRIWVGTIGGGAALFVRTNNQKHVEGFFKSYSTRQGLNYFNVNAIYEDRENSIWIGTDLGLNQYRGERFLTFDEADTIPNNIIWSVYKDKSNAIWLGTNNGLSKINFSYNFDGKLEQHSVTNYTTANGLPSQTILSVFQDSKGNMWMGTSNAGVAMLSAGSNKFSTLSTNNGLTNNIVYSIAEDKDGDIWFGTKEGASRYNPLTKEFRNYTVADGLGGNHVYRIFKDSKGLLWIGALGGNLCVFDGTTFKKYDEKNGFNHKFILSINEDKLGNIWFGCYGSGLFKFDGKTFTNYLQKDGMFSDSPYSIVIDGLNNVWVGHNKGLDKLDIKTNKFTHYGKSEGFFGVECNPNAGCIDDNGNIWFGTIMGAVRFNPKEDIFNSVKPLTKINGLRISLRDTTFPGEAIFSYKENNLTFKFIGVSLANPEKLNYLYTLEGFDKGWIPAKATQEATYTNLPAGKYTFRVKACNNDGIWSDEAIYTFTVKPPFWQTALFYGLMAAFIAFGVFVFDRVRTRKLKRAKLELEKKVEERTVQLAIKNEELAEKNKDITDSIRYAKRIQDASLCKEENLKAIIPNSYLYFKPKDIVSGDFYWVKKQGDDIFVAVVDCTGHGVPGAFLSIVANNIINQAFEQCANKQPNVILNEISKIASTALQSSVDSYQLRDGMDIALCKISTTNKTVEFAGAHNPLYLVRQNKLIEYPADHFSIGNTEGKQYTNQTFTYEENDFLFMFSDGFADQFGGEKGKKLKASNFQQILIKNINHDLDTQLDKLDKSFKEWKGNLEQIDDICVLGIRL